MFTVYQVVKPFKITFWFRFKFDKFYFTVSFPIQVQQVLFLKVQFRFRFRKFHFRGSISVQLRFVFKEIISVVVVDSVVKWLECRDCDQHGVGIKPTRAILLCSCKRHFTALSLLVRASNSKFQSYLYKTKKPNKNFKRTAISWCFRKQIGVIICLIYLRLRHFLVSWQVKIQMK